MIISAEITGSPPWIFSRKNGPKRPKTRGDTIVSSPVPRAGKREIHGWVGGKETEGVGAGRNWRGKERLVFLLSARVWSLRNCRYRSRVDLNNDPYGPCSLIQMKGFIFEVSSEDAYLFGLLLPFLYRCSPFCRNSTTILVHRTTVHM